MGQFWTKLVVIVHKIARFRTRKPNNTLSIFKNPQCFSVKELLLFYKR